MAKRKKTCATAVVLVVQKNTLQRALHVNRRKVVVHRLTSIGGTVAKINVAKPHNTHKVYTSVTRKKWQTCDKRHWIQCTHTLIDASKENLPGVHRSLFIAIARVVSSRSAYYPRSRMASLLAKTRPRCRFQNYFSILSCTMLSVHCPTFLCPKWVLKINNDQRRNLPTAETEPRAAN